VQEHFLQVTSVLFPMFKVFLESMKSGAPLAAGAAVHRVTLLPLHCTGADWTDMASATIRVYSLYNPMTSLLEPMYVSKARYDTIRADFDRSLPELLKGTSSPVFIPFCFSLILFCSSFACV
jgi:hypothetical protein